MLTPKVVYLIEVELECALEMLEDKNDIERFDFSLACMIWGISQLAKGQNITTQQVGQIVKKTVREIRKQSEIQLRSN